MALVTLTLAKKHLRVFHDDDDTEIEAYLAAAETIVEEYVDRAVYGSVTPAITAAILLLLGDLYENREADPESKGDAVLPRAVRALLAPYRVWRVLSEGE